MNPETLTALQQSIKKWERIAAGTGYDNASDDCALCQRFPSDVCSTLEGDEYEKCPVAIVSNRNGCGNTPYATWVRISRELDEGFPRKATTPALLALAQLELDFLRSLLPQD